MSNAKDIHKEMFPVYGVKCLSRKAVHNRVVKFSQGRSKIVDDETEVRIQTYMLRVWTHW
jgi:hypothetical protein